MVLAACERDIGIFGARESKSMKSQKHSDNAAGLREQHVLTTVIKYQRRASRAFPIRLSFYVVSLSFVSGLSLLVAQNLLIRGLLCQAPGVYFTSIV